MAKLQRHSDIPSGKLTWLWKITIFNGKIHCGWPFSIAMLNYQRVFIYRDSVFLIPLLAQPGRHEPINKCHDDLVRASTMAISESGCWSSSTACSLRNRFDMGLESFLDVLGTSNQGIWSFWSLHFANSRNMALLWNLALCVGTWQLSKGMHFYPLVIFGQ